MGKVITLDSQILSAICKCERLTNFTYVQNLGPLEKAVHLDKGDVLHICLSTHYNLKRTNPELAYSDLMEQSAQAGQERGYEVDAPIETSLEVVKTYKQYAEHYKGEDWIPIFTEKPFSKELYQDSELQIIYQGKPDLFVDSIAGKLPVDHKSSSRRTDPMFLSNQFIGYCWALECNNFVINEIGFQKTLAPAEKFRRHLFSYPTELIQEWVEVTVRKVKEFIKHVDEGLYPPNFTACRGLYGDCLFVPVCMSTPDARAWKISSLYSKREPWDVGAALGEKSNES